MHTSLSASEVQSSGDGGGGKAARSHTGAVREGVAWWYLEKHWDAPWGSYGEEIGRDQGGWQICVGGPILLGDSLQVRRRYVSYSFHF